MTVSALVTSLVEAFKSGDVVYPLISDLPQDMPSAERLQDRIVPELGMISAWKLGATLPEVRKRLGLPHAFFGAIPSDRVLLSPASLPANRIRQFGVETEVTFRLGSNLPIGPSPVTREEVRAAVGSVHGSLEIPGTRFEELGGHGGFSLVGDNGATGWLVVGESVNQWNEVDLGNIGVSLVIDGIEVAQGTPAVVENGPFGALVDHVHRAHRRGYSLEAGQYIATGSCTGYVLAPPGKTVIGHFGDLGSVTMVIE